MAKKSVESWQPNKDWPVFKQVQGLKSGRQAADSIGVHYTVLNLAAVRREIPSAFLDGHRVFREDDLQYWKSHRASNGPIEPAQYEFMKDPRADVWIKCITAPTQDMIRLRYCLNLENLSTAAKGLIEMFETDVSGPLAFSQIARLFGVTRQAAQQRTALALKTVEARVLESGISEFERGVTEFEVHAPTDETVLPGAGEGSQQAGQDWGAGQAADNGALARPRRLFPHRS